MAVRIRLARRGRKARPIYDVVVADSRSPRDGKYIERLGLYNPNTNPATIEIDSEKAFEWVMKGAQPSDTVRAMLSYRGVMYRKHLQLGVIKGALSQEDADKKYQDWVEQKDEKIQGKIDRLATEKDKQAAERREAEAKVKEARAEALRQKQAEAEAANAPAAEEGEEAEAATEGEESTEAEGGEATEETKE
ncbi:MAG: 30S ribosomal protein S16 [Cyclobacteriaceae bacterium]